MWDGSAADKDPRGGLKALARWPGRSAVVLMLVLMLVLVSLLEFPAMPVGVHKDEHKDGKSDHGKDDHRRPVLPGLAQELEAVMDHDPHILHRAAA